MARYTIDFSTNAASIIREIEKVNNAITEVARTGKSVEIDLDATKLKQSIDATFKQLDKQIAKYERQLRKLKIGSPEFIGLAGQIGAREGVRERGTLQAQSARLREQAFAFEPGSAIALNKALQAARIEASQIKPATEEWMVLQRRIAAINFDLQQADKLAENIQMQQTLGVFAPGSLNQLEAKLGILRNKAREIAPSTVEWQKLNKEIAEIERGIERQTRRPLSTGQRFGAAGGAFLYGGGLGGGVGSALGGIGGGLIGGVPGAFTGAAVGQAVDNLTTMTSAMVTQAATLQKLRMGLAAASNDLTDYAQATREVQAISDNLLIPIEEVTRKFTQLRASTVALGIDTKTTAEMFQGVSAAVLQSGGSLEDVNGAMRAVVQVFSKGKLTAEELRGQLGERLPGAVVEFAQSAGMSTQELDKAFEAGTPSLDDFVKFLREKKDDTSGFVNEMATSSEYAGARMQKAFERLRLSVGQSLQPTGAAIQDFVTRSLNGFDKLIRKAIELEMIKPGAGFFEQQALLGGDGGIAGLEQRLLQAGAEESAARQQARAGGLGFMEDLLPEVAEATKQVKILEQALKNIRKAEKLTKTRQAQQQQQDDTDKRGQQFLDAVERRENAIAQARERYEEDIASIRENALRQAEALERRHQDQRIQDERELARVRRDLASAVEEEGLLRRSIGGEDPASIEQERQLGAAIRQYTEDKISAEEAAQDRQISQSREFEDFKRQNADAINKANERYANAIGKIQQEYAKSVAKLIETGSGNGAKRLAAAGKLIAAEIKRATQQQAFTAATGAAIIPRGSKFEVAGDLFDEAGLYQAAEAVSKVAGTAARAYVAATKDIDKAQQDLNATLKASAQGATVRLAAVSTADLDRQIQTRQEELTKSLAGLNEEKQALSKQENIRNALLRSIESAGRETSNNKKNIEEQTNAIAHQFQLISGGMLPALAEELAGREAIFDEQRKLTQEAADFLISRIEDKSIQEDVLTILEGQLEVIGQQESAYAASQQTLRNSIALLDEARIKSRTGLVGQGLRAGFINEAAAAYEEQLGKGVSPELAANVARATEQLTLAQMSANALQDTANGIGDAFAQSFSDIITGAQTAQASLAQFFKNTAKMFADMAMQMIAKWLIMKAIGLVAGMFGGGQTPGEQSSQGLQWDPVKMDFNPIKNANGNVLVGGFQAFANGGVVTGPTLGLVGEGRFNEAVVPLPDGRKIPVDLGGGAGNNISTNIVVNMNNGQASSQASGRGGQALGRELEGAVRNVILKETRPGGLIYGAR